MKRLRIENKPIIASQIQRYLEGNSESKFIHRLQVILFFTDREEETCDSLGAMFGHSPRSISNWIKKINKSGDIESLRSKPQQGPSSRLNKGQKVAIKKVLQDLPEEHDVPGKRWKGGNLSCYISRQYGITLNIRTCQRLLRELNIQEEKRDGKRE
jgi:transposase